MQIALSIRKSCIFALASLAVAFLAGCGGQDPILGTGGGAGVPPTVTSVAPVNNSVGVPINSTIITAAFSEPVAAISGGASFVVTCASPGINPVGVVSLDVTNRIATFSSTPLAPSTTYTATVTGVRSLSTGLTLVAPYIWHFTTGGTSDLTRPTVTLTLPLTTSPGPTLDVATNTSVTATFSEDMAPATLTSTSFTVTGPGLTPVGGNVTYSVGSKTGVFTPTSELAADTTFTATVTTEATDLAGNALAGDSALPLVANSYVWTFLTSAAPDTTSPILTLTDPADLATDVALNSNVKATFSETMDPLTLTTGTFTMQVKGPPLGPILPGTLVYDPLTSVATLTPSENLAASTQYIVTIIGAKDLAGNSLATGLVPNPWTFTTGTGLAPGAVDLGSASTFGIMATSAITSTGATVINGDVSLDPGTSMTGFPPGVVTGTIHINDSISAQARVDLLVAYNFAKNLPPGTTISAGADLGALYPSGIPPGIYTSGSTMLVSTPLTLDAGGNAEAVWVFQIGSSFTTTSSVSLANSAQAKNVFWVPTSDGTIGVGTIFYGTIISGRNVTGQTGAVINGRILAGAITAGTIALDDNVVNVPAP